MRGFLFKRKIPFFVILFLIFLTCGLYVAINFQESRGKILPMILIDLNFRGFDTLATEPTTALAEDTEATESSSPIPTAITKNTNTTELSSPTVTAITDDTIAIEPPSTTPTVIIETLEKPPSSSLYKCCTPLNTTLRTNIYFVKTHKTGGTTVQNIILRFALRNSLDVMNIIYGSYYLPFSDTSMFQQARTANNKYHILAHHIRYNSELARYQYPDTAMVTLLRHPAVLFQSMYDYFRFHESTGLSFQQFLNASIKPAFFYSLTSVFAYRGYNQMSYDLGFNLETHANNQTAIDEFVEKIDREFDFIMITEHMEISLVLLANLMGWPLENVAHLNINVRPHDPNHYKLTARDKSILMELNHVDTQLYHHFLQKFLKCVRRFGQEKLKREVIRLRMLNERFKERCVAKEHIGGLMDGYLQAIEYVPRNESDMECVYATSLEIPLETAATDEQFKRLQEENSKPWTDKSVAKETEDEK